jgi:hypothetical protein
VRLTRVMPTRIRILPFHSHLGLGLRALDDRQEAMNTMTKHTDVTRTTNASRRVCILNQRFINLPNSSTRQTRMMPIRTHALGPRGS